MPEPDVSIFLPLLVASVLAIVLLPVALECRRAWPRIGRMSLLLYAIVVLSSLYVVNRWDRSPELVRETDILSRPRQVASDGYVQSKTCRACHPGAYATWYRSYHRTMTQVATTEAVVGDFQDVRLEIGGRRYHLSRQDDKFFVDIHKASQDAVVPKSTSPAPAHHRGEILMTTGSHHMQAYWYSSGIGRLTVQLPFVWLLPEQAWIPEPHSFLRPDRPHGGDKMSHWNTTCITCHTTNGCQGGLQLDGTIETRAAEFGIACEACHGPAAKHVNTHRSPLRRYRAYFSPHADATIENPARMSPGKSSEVCAQCHASANLYASVEAARHAKTKGPVYRPGGDLSEEKLILQPSDPDSLQDARVRRVLAEHPLFVEGRFWSDGMARVSGTEYNAMIDSPCFQQGTMSCLSCHAMHQVESDVRPFEEWADDQLGVGMRGNLACTQCHEEIATSLTSHTHHRAESAGSSCYNCHMPYTTFGLLKAIRSHTVSSPSVQTSLATGRPNACNHCHLDRTMAWTAEHLDAWYGIDQPELTAEQHTVAAAVLWALTGDAGQRALTAWGLGWEDAQQASGRDWQAPYLAQLLVDPYPAVRIVAARSLIRLPELATFQYDLMGSAADREQARQRAIERWSRSQDDRFQTNRPSLLIDRQGRIQQDRFDELSTRRNDRVVSLEE